MNFVEEIRAIMKRVKVTERTYYAYVPVPGTTKRKLRMTKPIGQPAVYRLHIIDPEAHITDED